MFENKEVFKGKNMNKEEKTMFEIREVSNVDATGRAFVMWASGAVGVGACMAGAKLLVLALAC